MELSRQYQELKSLWDLSQSLYKHLRVDDLIMQIINRIKEVMDVEAVTVILHDEDNNEFVFCWSSESPERAEKLKEIRFPADYGIAGSVFSTGRVEIIPDVVNDPRHYSGVEAESNTEFRAESMIAAPLISKEKTLGVLEVINKKEGLFDEGDLNFVVTLVPMITMALDNARMYTKLERSHEKLKLINKDKDKVIKQTRSEVSVLRREVERHYRFDQIVGNSERMMAVFKLCERVIDTNITVLIVGETGTGKELIARTIHFNGPRKNKPFATQNCAGIPDTLLESELFGHKKGAFTGAIKDKKGLFETAHGGTVFLDEVAEMSPAMQASMLRVLQEGEIKPLGSDRTKQVDVRVISATNKNLEDEMKEGRLREDLFFRLSVFTIELPPLRERIDDIPLLTNHFIKRFNEKNKKSIKGLSRGARECLLSYPFQGNVRELENEIERAMAMVTDGNLIEISHLSERMRSKSSAHVSGLGSQKTLREIIEAVEKSVLSEALEKYGGNKTKVAKQLGLSRNGLMMKMQRHGL